MKVCDESLHDHVLLHHVESHVGGGEVGGRPHEGGTKHYGQVGGRHPVDILETGHSLKMLEQQEQC